MVLDDEVGEGGREAGLDGERPGAGRAERGKQAADTAGRAVLIRAGHRRPRPSPASIGERRPAAAGGLIWVLGFFWLGLVLWLVTRGRGLLLRARSEAAALGRTEDPGDYCNPFV
jgi:hypothetical protein